MEQVHVFIVDNLYAGVFNQGNALAIKFSSVKGNTATLWMPSSVALSIIRSLRAQPTNVRMESPQPDFTDADFSEEQLITVAAYKIDEYDNGLVMAVPRTDRPALQMHLGHAQTQRLAWYLSQSEKDLIDLENLTAGTS